MAAKRKQSLAKLTRPRLYSARKAPVTWLTEPPGAGKTTLIASYLEARNVPIFWYQLDAGDTDPAAFFSYLTVTIDDSGTARENLILNMVFRLTTNCRP
jgi:LuxR family transcriptional regulator, maltose regulon positive regulatory protein